MADPVADIGHGTILYFDPANGTTFVQLLKIQEITHPSKSAEEVDVTDLADTIVKTQSAILNDMGELSFKFFWEAKNTNQHVLYTAVASGAVGAWKITIPHGTPVNATFSGWVKSLTPDAFAQKAPIMNTCTVRVTTAVTWT